MAVDLSQIPTSELLDDLAEARTDSQACLIFIARGQTEYDGEPMEKLLRDNEECIAVIEAELARRQN